MSVSVVAPNLQAMSRRRMIPAPKNPIDMCTVVSIYPMPVDEIKPTIQPGRFQLAPGSFENPSILVVGASSWWREIDEEQPLLEIPNHSAQIADSIVKDYCNGMVGCDMHSAMPGLFWVAGKYDKKTLIAEKAADLVIAKQKQDNWWQVLVRMADVLWNNSNGNPIVITENMRLAARMLKLDGNKDWMRDFKMMENVRCGACGSPRDPNFPVCPNCKAVLDVKKAEELGLVFAKLGQ